MSTWFQLSDGTGAKYTPKAETNGEETTTYPLWNKLELGSFLFVRPGPKESGKHARDVCGVDE